MTSPRSNWLPDPPAKSGLAVGPGAARILPAPPCAFRPYFSVVDLVKRWPQSSVRREVLMISDGIDRFYGSGPDDPYPNSAIEAAQKAGIIVSAIYAPGVGHFGHSL